MPRRLAVSVVGVCAAVFLTTAPALAAVERRPASTRVAQTTPCTQGQRTSAKRPCVGPVTNRSGGGGGVATIVISVVVGAAVAAAALVLVRRHLATSSGGRR